MFLTESDPNIHMSVDLLRENARLVERQAFDPCVQWTLFENDRGRLLVVERTYREGVKMVINPTVEDIVRFRADPWAAWNEAIAE